MNSGYKTKAELIAWRRSQVLLLKSQGKRHEEIAQTLQVSPATITSDIHYLIHESKQMLRLFTIEKLPLQIRLAIAACEASARELWNISQIAIDNREKIMALIAFSNTQKILLHLMFESETAVAPIMDELTRKLGPEEIKALREQDRRTWAHQYR